MRRTFAVTFIVVVGLALFYLILRASSPATAGTNEVDTMCLASKIGLPCNPH